MIHLLVDSIQCFIHILTRRLINSPSFFLIIFFVTGESGLGKSTLINSLFLTDIYSSQYPGPSQRIKKTVKVGAVTKRCWLLGTIHSSSVWWNKVYHVISNDECIPPFTWRMIGTWNTLYPHITTNHNLQTMNQWFNSSIGNAVDISDDISRVCPELTAWMEMNVSMCTGLLQRSKQDLICLRSLLITPVNR